MRVHVALTPGEFPDLALGGRRPSVEAAPTAFSRGLRRWCARASPSRRRRGPRAGPGALPSAFCLPASRGGPDRRLRPRHSPPTSPDSVGGRTPPDHDQRTAAMSRLPGSRRGCRRLTNVERRCAGGLACLDVKCSAGEKEGSHSRMSLRGLLAAASPGLAGCRADRLRHAAAALESSTGAPRPAAKDSGWARPS